MFYEYIHYDYDEYRKSIAINDNSITIFNKNSMILVNTINLCDIFGLVIDNDILTINYFDRFNSPTKIVSDYIGFYDRNIAHKTYSNLLNKLNIHGKTYLFVINPVSGSGKADKLFNNKILPVMKNSFYNFQVVKTENKTSVETYLANTQNVFDAIISIGGDGTTFDIIQALKKLDIHVPLAIIPSGSGNGLSKSLNCLFGYKNNYNIYDYIYCIFRGTVRKLDTTLCATLNRNYWSMLGQSWGLPSDIDIKSEYMRCIGSTRYTLQAIIEFCRMKTYQGTIKYLPHSSENLTLVAREGINVLNAYHNDCVCIQSDFNMLWACQVPYMSDDAHIAPNATMCDKTIYLVIIDAKSRISRYQLVKLFMSLSSGTHVNNPHIQIIPVVAYSLTTHQTCENKRSVITIDGEKSDDTCIKVCIDKPINFIF